MAEQDKQPAKPSETPSQAPAPEAPKPASPEVDAYEDSLKQRMDLLKEVTSGNAPPGQPAEVPPGQASSGKEPYSEAEKAGQPAKPMTDAEKKNKDFADFVQKSGAEAKSASLGELIGKLMESVKNLSGMLSGFMDKLSGTAKKSADKAMPADKFSREELDKIKVDLEKDKDKPYTSQDRSVEYVTSVIGLTPKETPQKLLDSLKNSGMVFETDPGKMNDLKPGDALFFRKKNDEGESFAYLSAVVSNADPLKMKLIPKGGGVPQEMTVKESEYFKNEWFGFVKLPRKEAQPSTPPAALAASAPEPESKDNTPPQPSTPV